MKPQNQENGMPGLNESNATALAGLQVTSNTPVSSSASSVYHNSSSTGKQFSKWIF